MTTISRVLVRGTVATVAAGAMAMASMTPALAQDRYRNHDDGIDAGTIIAGALIIGGIAAVASSIGNGNRDRGYNGGYYGDRDDRRYGYSSPRSAVEQCVQVAESNASRYSYGGQAKVTDIRKVDRKRDGYKIEGRIAVNTMNRNYRSGDRRYGSGWGGDYRGYNDRYAGYDSGKFKCQVKYGRVVDLDYSGIRGL